MSTSGLPFPYPFFPIPFTKTGEVFQPSAVDALLAGLAATGARPTDLFLISHGWNNNTQDAESLYRGLSGQLAAEIPKINALAGRSFAVCGIQWPSKKFEDKDLIPSGAASLNDAVSDAKLRERVGDLRNLMHAAGWPGETVDRSAEEKLAGLEEAIDDWEDDPAVRIQAVATLRGLLPRDSADAEDASDKFLSMKPEGLIHNLARSLNPPPQAPQGTSAASLDPFSVESGGGVGGAASFRDVLGGLKAGFLHLLNFTTYYLMKARAGHVGVKGVSPLIQQIRVGRPDLRIHLIGHSFGCRVVTAAVNSLPAGEQLHPNTMTLLQGAFSHNGFALRFDGVNDGAFRPVVAQKKVRGPILITHTRKDKAVGVAYPIASRLAGQVAAALGDENDLYGGLGSNGAQTAQTTPERVVGTLLECGGDYPFAKGETSGKLYNLRADTFVSGHSDIVKPQIGYAVAVAMATPDAA